MTEYQEEMSAAMDRDYLQNETGKSLEEQHLFETNTNGSGEVEQSLEQSASNREEDHLDLAYDDDDDDSNKTNNIHFNKDTSRLNRPIESEQAIQSILVTKESMMTQRSPVIATNVSVPPGIVTKSHEESVEQKVITCLSSHMLSQASDVQDDSQESIGMKNNEQMGMCTDEESSMDNESLSQDPIPNERVILHHSTSRHSLSSNAVFLHRSSPSSVTAPVICMGPSSNLVLPYDIPRGQGLPPVSTIIRSTSMARYDRANLNAMNSSHHMGSVNLHSEAQVSRMNTGMPIESLATSNLNIRNLASFSPHRSVVVSASSSGISSIRASMDGIDHCRLIQHTSSLSPPSPNDISSKENLLIGLNNSHIQNRCKELSEEVEQDDNLDGSDYEQSDLLESIRHKYIANPHIYAETLRDYASSVCLPMNMVGLSPQHQTRITPEMAEMINNMVQRSGVLQRENSLEDTNDLMTEIPESSIHSSPSGLIISPHQTRHHQRIVIGNCTSLSSDETSEGSSPILSVDSDLECKVHDLTRTNTNKRHHHQPIEGVRQLGQSVLVQGIPRGVITSALSSMQMCPSSIEDDMKNNKSNMSVMHELLDSGEAEDLSRKVHCSINSNENSDILMTSKADQQSSRESSPLHNVSSSVLPSFLSSLAGTSLASLSASLGSSLTSLQLGIPSTTSSSFVPLNDNSMNPSPTCISSSGTILLSNIMAGPNAVKQESATNRSQIVTTTASPVTSLYSSLPALHSISPFIKQELPSPSNGSLPPFPVISSSSKRDLHSASLLGTSILSSQSTHPIMSVVQTTTANSLSNFMGSCTQLPPYSSMRVSALPPLNIPGASSSSDSPASSPMTSGGIHSDNSPISLSPKKNDKLKDMGGGGGMSGMNSSSMGISNNNLMLHDGGGGGKEEKEDRKWCCIMCRNGSPCGLHPTNMQMATSSISPGALPSGDPAKPYQCTICGKNLASKNVFQLHMRSHSGEKPFRCNLCGHHFSQKTSLTRHMRSHTGERPFPCGVCGKRFADKERIKIHMRTHTGEKPFACEVCGKRFSQKSTVKRHMSVHTGEKPFKCEACGKGFANRGNLNAHAKTHANS